MSIAEKFETIADAVYEKGNAIGKTEFSNMLSRNGKRLRWRNVFESSDFSGYTFEPEIYPTSLGSVFFNYSGQSLPEGINFSKAIIAETESDTSVIPYQMFAYCRNVDRIPDMNIPVQYRYTYTYRICSAKIIDIIRVAETTEYSNAFAGCSNLESVNFEGTIGRSISFADSPLSIESVKSVISHLKNFTEDDPDNKDKYTLTFYADCWDKLEASGTAPDGGTWKDYVIKLGWLTV